MINSIIPFRTRLPQRELFYLPADGEYLKKREGEIEWRAYTTSVKEKCTSLGAQTLEV